MLMIDGRSRKASTRFIRKMRSRKYSEAARKIGEKRAFRHGRPHVVCNKAAVKLVWAEGCA